MHDRTTLLSVAITYCALTLCGCAEDHARTIASCTVNCRSADAGKALHSALDAGARDASAGTRDSGLPRLDAATLRPRPRDAGPEAAVRDSAPADAGSGTCPQGTHRDDGSNCVADGLLDPCEVPWNVMHMEGGFYVTTGIVHVTEGDWVGKAADNIFDDGLVDTVEVQVTLPGERQPFRELDLSAAGTGEALAAQRYDGATRYPFSITDRKPGFSLMSPGKGCNQEFGWFEVHELDAVPGELRHLLATFEHHCEGNPNATLGCIRYSAADWTGEDAGR